MREGAFGEGEHFQRIAAAAACAVFIAALAAPLCCVIAQSFDGGLSAAAENYAGALLKKRMARAVGHSFLVSGIVASASTAIAFMCAYFLWLSRLPGAVRAFFRTCIMSAFFFPSITYGFAVIFSFGRQGLVTQLLGFRLPFSIYGFSGLVIAGTVYTLPYAFMLLENAFSYISPNTRTVCAMLGDGPARQFVMSALRPAASAIVSSFLLTFFLNFTDFGIPSSVAGRYEVLATALYGTMMGAVPDFGRGAAVAVVMLLPSVLALLVLRRGSALQQPSQASSVQPLGAGRAATAAGIAWLAAVALCLISVFAVIFVLPFVENWPYKPVFTLSHVAAALGDPQLESAYFNSLHVALLTVIFGLALCLGCALVSARPALGRGWSALADFAAMLTNTVPGMVLGVGFMFAFSGTPIYGTFAIIVLCNIVHFFTTPYLMCKDALSRLNRGYEVTGALMGDTYGRTLRRVIIPNIVPTLCSAGAYLFINAMVTVSAVVFICGAQTQVVTTRIRELQYFERYDAIFALSLLIFFTNVAAKALSDLLSGAVSRLRSVRVRLNQKPVERKMPNEA
jgi:iron(III) transport system permease protein